MNCKTIQEASECPYLASKLKIAQEIANDWVKTRTSEQDKIKILEATLVDENDLFYAASSSLIGKTSDIRIDVSKVHSIDMELV